MNISLFLIILALLPFGQIEYSSFFDSSKTWSTDNAVEIIENNLASLYESQQQNINRLIVPAKERYDAFLVFHVVIKLKEESGRNNLCIFLEDSDLPLDLYFLDGYKTRVVVPCYKGKFYFAERGYTTFVPGYGKKMRRALKRILKKKPERVFTWELDPLNYMYLKDGQVFYYDTRSGKIIPLLNRLSTIERTINYRESIGLSTEEE